MTGADAHALPYSCAPCLQWAVNRLQNVLRVEGGARTGFLPLAQTNVTQCGGDFWSRSVVNREVRDGVANP